MLRHDLENWHKAPVAGGPVIFDRGLPDLLGFCLVEGIDPPADLLVAIDTCRYQSPVFIAPPWPEIYARDKERIQSPEEAEASYLRIRDVYPRCGYRLVELPRADIAARVAFVRSFL